MIVVERDPGIIFDITDTDFQIEGLSGYVLENRGIHVPRGFHNESLSLPLK